MSRIDGKFSAAGEAPLDLAELLSVFGAQQETSVQDWRDAITCYLSASEGWRDASQRLGGAFAGDGTEPSPGEDRSREQDINHRVSEYLQRGLLKDKRTDND